jgi:hypothetical protein
MSKDKDKWLDAMKKEISALIKLGTFRRRDMTRGPRSSTKPVKSKFVFEIKKDGRYKCRLVACGYSQREGVDFYETYSPTASFKSFLTLMHICGTMNHRLCTIDVGNAFLESKLDVNLSMNMPKEFFNLIGIEEEPIEIVGALYGLKQSGRLWYQKLVTILVDYGFKQCIYDPCVFCLINPNGEEVRVCCHVDDLAIISSNEDTESKFLTYLKSKVQKIVINTEKIVYLGMEIDRDLGARTVMISQRAYVQECIDEYLGKDSNETSKYPMGNKELSNCISDGNEPIHNVIGKLRFLGDRSRPDLLFPINKLSSYLVNPSDGVVDEVKTLLKYINGTKGLFLTVGGCDPIELFGLTDASFVQEGDCRSQLGYAVYLGTESGAVYCSSKRNSLVSLSSTQSEVDALVSLVKDIIWCQGFLEFLGVRPHSATTVWCDNSPAVTLTHEGNHLKRSKHFIVKTTWLKEQVEVGVVEVQHIPGLENHADILTKALSGHLLRKHTAGILGFPPETT